MRLLKNMSGTSRLVLLACALSILLNGARISNAQLVVAGIVLGALALAPLVPFLIRALKGDIAYFAVVYTTDHNGRHEIWSGQFNGYLAANAGLKSAIDRFDSLGSEYDYFDKQAEIKSVVLSKSARTAFQ